MAFCPNCGKEVKSDERFCRSCGKNLELPQRAQSPQPVQEVEETQDASEEESPVIRTPIPETSRLSGIGIEKYLAPGEHIIYSTTGRIWVNKKQERAYVTNERLIFYHREGVLLGLVKNERLNERQLTEIGGKITLREEGLIGKKLYLELSDMRISGDRGDLLGLYKALQSAKRS